VEKLISCVIPTERANSICCPHEGSQSTYVSEFIRNQYEFATEGITLHMVFSIVRNGRCTNDSEMRDIVTMGASKR